MNKTSDVVIIGAGIIGSSIAYRLASKGQNVAVIDKGHPGREATWAAAGMLAPHTEIAHSVPDVLLNLFEKSYDLFPEFIEEIRDASGLKIGYQTKGSILTASDFQEAKLLSGLFEKLATRGVKVEELGTHELQKTEPELAHSVETALFLPEEHYVNNRELLRAVVKAGQNKGVTFINDTPVTGFDFDRKHVQAIHLPDRDLFAETYINCAGSWAGLIDATNAIKIPVRPIRGQIIQLQLNPQKLNHLIHSSSVYLVPWPDGRTLVGATMENVGFDKTNTAGGFRHLIDAALNLIPSLQQAQVKDFWAGLRPDTPDNLPLLGKTSFDNYFIAAGHFRNGILLTPITAKLMSELIFTGKPSICLDPFDPLRFK